MTTYGSGKYDLQSMNDGRTEIRWKDPKTGFHYRHIIKNIDELFDNYMLSTIQTHVDNLIKQFTLYCTDTIGFLNQPEENWSFFKLMPESKQNINTHFSSQQVFEMFTQDFVLAYNSYHKTFVSLEKVLPELQKYQHTF